MIKVICGMIGSGKTTYAINTKNKNDMLLDLDLLKEAFFKNDNIDVLKQTQIKLLEILGTKFNVYYITCYPTYEEKEIFDMISDIEYIWINTSISQCTENIKRRNRNNEIENIKELNDRNIKIQSKYLYSDINFKIVDVFLSNEKW